MISTYRDRLVEDKYSYRAELAEIAENDFNLNEPIKKIILILLLKAVILFFKGFPKQ
ncbi:MAG: hypothetical protein AAFQ80_07370 [Cyanobacteria bacterium J06621_8]